MKRLFKILRNTALTIIGLLILAVVLVNFTPVQNFIARRAAIMLSDKLKTTVSIKHVRIDFLNHLVLQGLYIEDRAHDTLLYAGEAEVRITDWFVVKKEKPVLQYLGLHNARVHMYRTDSSREWNYQFIADAFGTGKKDTITTKSEFELDLKKIDLQDVRFHMDDAWGGSDMDFDVGSLQMDARNIDLKKRIIELNGISIGNTNVVMRDYEAGKPYDSTAAAKGYPVDTTPFNTGHWMVQLDKLSLTGCLFQLTSNDLKPQPNEFDADHLSIKNININISNIRIADDTIHGNIDKLTATERCGIMVKAMRSKVTVSPNASICENLYLETNNSKLRDYYAMRYRRFPDFTSYIDSVVMVAHLKDAVVDSKDIAYFAPTLRKYPGLLHVSGNGEGTVAKIAAKQLQVTDGYTTIKGDIKMTGLPDIYKTAIEYNGAFLTTGEGIFKYVPALRHDPNIALEKISYAYFNGSYSGYIDNFAVNGTLATNLGSITSETKMNLPDFNSNRAVYSGTVSTANFNLGALLREPDLGIISAKANIKGIAFDPGHAQIEINGDLGKFEYRGYVYQNISAQGVLAKKQFSGSLQVVDPNLALAFNGSLDFSRKLVSVNAKANLLSSNFLALKLTKDTITAVGDFDLNCTGSNIDNFSGYAKLYNIDLRRNQHRLDLDSIYINSTGDTTNRRLTVQSNDIVAGIYGRYQLSKLPASIQYYLSGYIPNYIKTPDKYAPEQNISFTITTNRVDSLLGVLVPFITGFDSSVINGSLNTQQQKLTLNAHVPYGSIGNVHLNNIDLSGDGSFNALALNVQVDDVALGDSIIDGSLSVTGTLASDSLRFTIATTTPDGYNSVTLNGGAFARKDSLFLSLLPSQFYLNKEKWTIAGGSQAAFSTNYLMVKDLALQSGTQKITVNTQVQPNDQPLGINIENLDLGQLGSSAGLAVYEPNGKVNGTVTISNIFKHLFVEANLKATGVMLGADTLGNVNIVGNYDGVKKLVNLDPVSGIYRDNASITVSGDLSFDSTKHERINGNIQLNNAPIALTSSFLTGFMSHLSGTVNGKINIGGTSDAPDIAGTVALRNAGMRIDFMGTYYTIPSADINVDNKKIDFGHVTIYDIYQNTAQLTGYFSHNHFKDMRMRLTLKSPKFEVINLQDYENPVFYGNLVAGIDSFTIRGHFDDIHLRIVNAVPVERSHISIPIASSTDLGTYSYVSFKSYNKVTAPNAYRSKNKLSLNIDANLNNLAELTLVLDPSTGDQITARGNGNIQLSMPANDELRMFGRYNIEDGDYLFTFKQLSLRKDFILNQDSKIDFNGPLGQTSMDVNATYSVRTRLYDLLSENEKQNGFMPENEVTDAKVSQDVNVLLRMNGSLKDPKLGFNVKLADTRSIGTYAYTKLERINQDDRQLLDQVASLLIIGDFIPPEGIASNSAVSGAINNISQVLSQTASSQLTNLVNKIFGNKDVAVDLKYTNYNLSDPTLGGINRNQLSLGVRKNYFHDKLIVELGSKSDWGRPASATTNSNFNIAGDFRIQLLLTPSGGLRLNGFRTSDYDVTLDRDITRSGVGISWRKSFDDLSDFFHGNHYLKRQEELRKVMSADTVKRTGGTW